MIYVFDTNSLSNILNHYYIERFPSFWEKFDGFVKDGNLVSVREANFELKEKFSQEEIKRLSIHNASFFANPASQELAFVAQIYSVPHFQRNLERKKLIKGGYLADPFVIAKAATVNGIVITEEQFKDNAAKIPNICMHFGVECLSLQGFLTNEDWKF